MYKQIWILLTLFSLFLGKNCLAVDNQQNIYTEDKLGISVTADSPTFTIKLKSNPTTGYSWFLRDYNSQLITPLRQEFESNPDKKLMGAPGYELWTFHVRAIGFSVPQQTLIRLVYAQINIRDLELLTQIYELILHKLFF